MKNVELIEEIKKLRTAVEGLTSALWNIPDSFTEQQITAVSSNGKTSDSKSENESSILSAVATELEKAAIARREQINGDAFEIDILKLFEDLFKDGARWLADKILNPDSIYATRPNDTTISRLRELTKTSEGK